VITTEEQLQRLTGIVESLPGTVVAHDNQIDGLIKVAEKHQEQIANLEKQWQAYINMLPRN
jgi:hypothetical protein